MLNANRIRKNIKVPTKLDIDEKCNYAIMVAEIASEYITDGTSKDLIHKAIDLAKQWNKTQCDVGEKLYNFLDNEENGFTLIQEMENDEKKISAWNCIIDAIALVSKAAYESKETKYLPEPIELVDDNIFYHMKQCLLLCDETKAELLEKELKK